MSRTITAGGGLVILLLVWGAAIPAARADEPRAVEESGIWQQVLRLYERAKAAGEQVPRDVYDWARQDLQAVGRWEYLVREVDATESERLEQTLDELGAERWECVWIAPDGKGRKARIVLKRPVRSYLRQLPLVELMKVLPVGGAAGDGD